MENKKNILIITPYMPFPLNSGGNVAQFSLINGLRNDFNIHLVFPLESYNNKDFHDLKTKWEDVHFYPFIESFRFKLGRFLSNRVPVLFYDFVSLSLLKKQGISKRDVSIYKTAGIFKNINIFFDIYFLRLLESIITEKKIDVVQVEFFDLISLGSFLPRNITKIFVHHEIRFIRDLRFFQLMEKSYPLIDYLLLKNKGIELSLLEAYDKVVTLSTIDKDELLTYNPLLNIDVSPVPIINKLPSEGIEHFNFSNSITFLGGETHFPNKDAVDWFIENCWSKIKEIYPQITLKIIGVWSEESKLYYKNDSSITFRGFVDDLSVELKNSIFIAPIRIGSGVRMKIIEAINIGCPIISTTVGMEGLDFINNIDFLVANTPKDFVDDICKLIEDYDLSNRLIINARNTLSEKYSFINLIEKRKFIYEF